ncbi:MAG TPA: YceI family protein [Bacteroides sp.]|nr:YceI family protein [Bacteroides sp.]
MKNKRLFSIALAVLMTASAFSRTGDKLVSSKSHIKFYSHTAMEDIEANNYASVSTLNTKTGDVVFSVPMQGFEFENASMQKHFNQEKFLDTKDHPKGKLVAKIANFDDIDFSNDGVYEVIVEGNLTIKGTTKSLKEKGTVRVKDGIVSIESKFPITLADYGISFAKGKPSTNIAKTVEVTVIGEYTAE